MVFPDQMEAIDVSSEMLTLLGAGVVGSHCWPARSVAFEIDTQLRLTFHASPTAASVNAGRQRERVVMLVDRAACERLHGAPIAFHDGTAYLLPADLRAIALAIRDCTMPDAVALPYRLAKSIELLCEILRAHGEGRLVANGSGALPTADYQRITVARQFIDDHWQEPLTLASIARTCGINRSKLSRGFRELYRCTVSEALAERRLAEARLQLISTDLPIGLIGYRSGYQNNASFSRAFCRRFGVPPSNFRNTSMAAA